MAGIGFELRKMLDQRDGFVAQVRAYACAGLISSGPWIMTILTLTLLSVAGPYVGGESGYTLFRALVTYTFAFSLILQGIFQMAVTRRVADLLYGHKYASVLPAFVACVIFVAVVQAAIGTAFCICAKFSPALSFVCVTLYVIVSVTWLSLVWLSVTREYDEVLRAYIYGMLVSLLSLALLGLREGTAGLMVAYTAGQGFTLLLLVRTIARGMEAGGNRDFSIVTSLGEFPKLVGVGLFYNGAIWVDKIIFWFTDGKHAHSLVRYHPLYDTCCFLAYMTVVPALAVNLVRLETSFYEHYRAYYGSILGGTPLSVIEDKRTRMLENLKESTVRLLRIQGAITLFFLLFAGYVMDLLHMPPFAARIFRLTSLGAFFHVLLLITILMQLYFDFRTQALVSAAVFFCLNAGLAEWSVVQGKETYGIGYAIASFLSLLLGYTLLNRGLERLDFYTFTSQPLGGDAPEEAEAVAEQGDNSFEKEEETDEEGAGEEGERPLRAVPAPAVADAGEFAPLPAAEGATAPATEAPEETIEPASPARAPDETRTEFGMPEPLPQRPAASAPPPAPAPHEAARDEDETLTELAALKIESPQKIVIHVPPPPPRKEEPPVPRKRPRKKEISKADETQTEFEGALPFGDSPPEDSPPHAPPPVEPKRPERVGVQEVGPARPAPGKRRGEKEVETETEFDG